MTQRPLEAARTDLFNYAIMALPLAVAGLPIYLHAPDFYGREFGVPLASIGVALLVLRIIDAVQDPLIGLLSDRFSSFRSPILLGGVALLAAGLWMIFHPPQRWPLAWFSVSILICTTGYSIVAINFQALGGLWHASEHGRTRITAWREGFGLVGLLAGAALPGLLGATDDAGQAFHWLTLIYLPMIVVATILLLRWLKTVELDDSGEQRDMAGWRELLASSWRRRFFGLYSLNVFANSCPAVLVIFFVRERIQADDAGVFLVLYFLSGALAMGLWQRVARALGKYRCWMLSMVLAIATFIWALFLGAGDAVAFGVICVLSGIALGADLALPPSMLADHIAHEREQAHAASYFAVLAFLAKGALALASGILLSVLGAAGFQPGAPTTAQGLFALTLGYALLPCLIKAALAFWLWRSLPRLQYAAAPARTTV